MSDTPVSSDQCNQLPSEPTAGVSAGRQLVFPETVVQDNRVRSRIPLVTEAPVFEFEPVAPPTPSGGLPKLLRRRWMRLRQFVRGHLVWLAIMLLLSVAVVLIVAVISPVPRPSAPPVRR
jgi:hypothetical protein